MTVDSFDPPSPVPPSRQPSRINRAIHRLGAVALTGGTVAGATTIWPIILVPVGVFIAAATLAVETIAILADGE